MDAISGSTWSQLVRFKDRRGPIDCSWFDTLGLTAMLAVAYFLLGRMAFSMAVSEGSATSVAFLPEGVALAFCIIFGRRVWVGVLLGQFALSTSLGVPVAVGLSFGLVNSAANIFGGYLFWKLRISPSLDRPRDIALLFGLSALALQPLAAAAKVIPRLSISNPENIIHLSTYSWAGNTMGQFLIAPLLLSWCSVGFRLRVPELRRALAIVCTYFLAILAFKAAKLGETDSLYWLAVFGMFYLVLIWVAVQSRVPTTSLTNLLTTMGFLWTITSSPDSLLYFSTQDRVLYADVLILGGIVTALLISALFGQLTDRTQQLNEANIAKEKIFSVLGHDLRSPIASLKSALHLMGEGILSKEEFLHFHSELYRRVDHTHLTLENLMEWGSSQTTGLYPYPTSLTLRNLSSATIELLRPQADGKKLTLVDHIPPTASVLADRHHATSILRNILSNALKFTPEGGTITLSATPVDLAWRISIRDTGIGMSPDTARELLHDRPRNTSTLGTAQERGLGLGLHICRDFLKANHGTIEIESELQHGTAVYFTLPRAEVA